MVAVLSSSIVLSSLEAHFAMPSALLTSHRRKHDFALLDSQPLEGPCDFIVWVSDKMKYLIL
ncbi:hypothetical protein K2173_025692 [Erythroxylum novogranatense]|uniref:Uncharacterized protein n=1 Tax=Erythroxylum novogranatense TaxID=1862640 RepID=A0AAV8SBA5_9ROSI|nr:hypothetical protein K2173_025692 [Erythroxylum novogranatense]